MLNIIGLFVVERVVQVNLAVFGQRRASSINDHNGVVHTVYVFDRFVPARNDGDLVRCCKSYDFLFEIVPVLAHGVAKLIASSWVGNQHGFFGEHHKFGAFAFCSGNELSNFGDVGFDVCGRLKLSCSYFHESLHFLLLNYGLGNHDARVFRRPAQAHTVAWLNASKFLIEIQACH